MKEEIANILSSTDKPWFFVNLKVKTSPHTHPIIVTRAYKKGDEWMLEWDQQGFPCEMKLSEVNDRAVLSTLLQRIKWETYKAKENIQ